MTLNVISFGAYACYINPDWRKADYDIYRFVKALKAEEFRGYADIHAVDGTKHRITAKSRDLAMHVFSLWGEQILRGLGLRDIVLIPVPASDCTSFHTLSCPYWMAHMLQRRTPDITTVGNWLRFTQKQHKSHDGGSRDPAILRAALDVSEDCRPITGILIDDVKTTGAHLQAAAQQLRRHGVHIDTALVAARSVWAQQPNPYVMAIENLDAPFPALNSTFFKGM